MLSGTEPLPLSPELKDLLRTRARAFVTCAQVCAESVVKADGGLRPESSKPGAVAIPLCRRRSWSCEMVKMLPVFSQVSRAGPIGGK
jgi:hypothetical protein